MTTTHKIVCEFLSDERFDAEHLIMLLSNATIDETPFEADGFFWISMTEEKA